MYMIDWSALMNDCDDLQSENESSSKLIIASAHQTKGTGNRYFQTSYLINFAFIRIKLEMYGMMLFIGWSIWRKLGVKS